MGIFDSFTTPQTTSKKSTAQLPVQSGRLLVLDGIDGCGKTTQVDLLIRALDFAGYDAVQLKFPRYGEKSAALIEYYLSGKYKNLKPEAAALLYAIDRFDSAEQIQNLLSAGKVVVCDRYSLANSAHQGSKLKNQADRIKFYKWLDDIEYRILQIPRPHLNVILHVPIEIAAELKARQHTANNTQADIHEADLGYLRKTAETFIELAHLIPNTKLVNCMEHQKLLPQQAVHNKIWDIARRIGLKDLLPSK